MTTTIPATSASPRMRSSEAAVRVGAAVMYEG
jgi:hypothetical protein